MLDSLTKHLLRTAAASFTHALQESRDFTGPEACVDLGDVVLTNMIHVLERVNKPVVLLHDGGRPYCPRGCSNVTAVQITNDCGGPLQEAIASLEVLMDAHDDPGRLLVIIDVLDAKHRMRSWMRRNPLPKVYTAVTAALIPHDWDGTLVNVLDAATGFVTHSRYGSVSERPSVICHERPGGGDEAVWTYSGDTDPVLFPLCQAGSGTVQRPVGSLSVLADPGTKVTAADLSGKPALAEFIARFVMEDVCISMPIELAKIDDVLVAAMMFAQLGMLVVSNDGVTPILSIQLSRLVCRLVVTDPGTVVVKAVPSLRFDEAMDLLDRHAMQEQPIRPDGSGAAA